MSEALRLQNIVKKSTQPFSGDPEKTGLATGAIPYSVDEISGAIKIVMHSKTSNAPNNVELGQSKKGEISPSPLQLKRGETVSSYSGPINSMVLPNREVRGPQKIVDEFGIEKVIPLVVNSDSQGSRLESAYLYSVNSLENATSVFGDGAATTFEIQTDGSVIVTGVNIEGVFTEEKVIIPRALLTDWMNGDDSSREGVNSLGLQNSGMQLKPTVPAAALLRKIAETRDSAIRRAISGQSKLIADDIQ